MMSVYSRSPYIRVTPQNGIGWMDMSRVSAGMVRYNSSSSCLEVYDGSTWHLLNQSYALDLEPDVIDAMNWVRIQMLKEQQLQQLMEQHPGLQDLHDRFQIMLKLVQNDQQ